MLRSCARARRQQMCTYQYQGEWYFSRRSTQMSDLSGFKKLHINVWERSNISHRTRVWKSSQWDDVKKKNGGGGWRQMYAERCRCEEGSQRKVGGEAPVFKFFRFVVGFLLLWEIKTNYITQLTCPLRFLRNCGSAWHWSASYKGNVGGWWCNASPLWGHASLSCQAESTLCTSTYRRPIIIISNGNTVNPAIVFIWYDNIFSKIGHKFQRNTLRIRKIRL